MNDQNKGKKPVDELVKFSPSALVTQLREIVQPKGKRGSWLRHMSDAQLLELYWRAKQGQPAYSLVKMAQQEWGYGRKSDTKSLHRSMSAFLKQAVGTIEYALTTEKDPEEKDKIKRDRKKIKEYANDFNLLQHVAYHITILNGRCEMWMEKEATTKMPLKGTENAYKTLLAWVEKYWEIARKLGILEVQPDEYNLNVQGAVGHMMQFVKDKDSMVAFSQRFLEKTKDMSHKLVEGPDGQLQMIPASEAAGEVIDITPVMPDTGGEDGTDSVAPE